MLGAAARWLDAFAVLLAWLFFALVIVADTARSLLAASPSLHTTDNRWAAQVWRVVRDFSAVPRHFDGVNDVALVGEGNATSVGIVRYDKQRMRVAVAPLLTLRAA